MQGKVCGKKRHTKTEIRSEISELICGRIAAGENYNLTRDNKWFYRSDRYGNYEGTEGFTFLCGYGGKR